MINQNEINAIEVSFSGIGETELKQRQLAVALACLALVPKKAISSVIKMAAPHLERLIATHANPTGTDVRGIVALWTDPQRIAILLATFGRAGYTPAQMVKRFWHYATVTGAQRSGNDYLALKCHHKVVAFCAWIVSGTPLADWAKCKYLVAQVMIAEVLNLDVIQNSDAYSVYQSHTSRLESLTSDVSDDLRKRLLDVQLYKSAATASTQRTTSANILQILGVGVNAGNERCIYFDRESDLYLAMRVSLMGDAGF